MLGTQGIILQEEDGGVMGIWSFLVESVGLQGKGLKGGSDGGELPRVVRRGP